MPRKARSSIDAFAALLRRHRTEAGLSQLALAERAGLSIDAIGGYERGLRFAPRAHTIAALADALRLAGTARDEFEEAAHRKGDEAPAELPGALHHFPWQATSFVGRYEELAEIAQMLATHRFVTLTGAGGIGKTRTALEIASHLHAAPADGVWFVDLTRVGEASLVAAAAASQLDLQLPDNDDPAGALAAALESRRMLVILDNCEHVIAAARTLAREIMQSCRRISLLATSRERLGIAGEVAYRLAPLPVESALQLFAQRGEAASYGFKIAGEDAQAAADVCRRLDGIPLAIELAAARAPNLGLTELRARLATHFRIVAAGAGDLPERQQTLFSAIAWSYELLSGPERTLFRRLAPFASGWGLDAAESVCAGDGLETPQVLDALLSLVEKSLVNVDLAAASPRYAFFDSTRAFALERLHECGEERGARERHARWVAQMADRAFDQFVGSTRTQWERAIAPEIPNALAALDWSLGPEGDAVLAGRIASGLEGFWQAAGLAEGRRYVTAALDLIDEREQPLVAGRLLIVNSRFLHGDELVASLGRAIALLEATNDRLTLARCHGVLGIALANVGRYEEAAAANAIAGEILLREGLEHSALYVSHLFSLCALMRAMGRSDRAKAAMKRALDIAATLEDDRILARALPNLAQMEFEAGNLREAVRLSLESMGGGNGRARSDYQDILCMCNLACYYLLLGEAEEAGDVAKRAIAAARGHNPNAVQLSLQHVATACALTGDAERAALLLGYVEAWCERNGAVRDPIDRAGYDLLLRSLRAQLSGERIAVLASEGAALDEGAAIDHALAAAAGSHAGRGVARGG